jgi:hypothetical protein
LECGKVQPTDLRNVTFLKRPNMPRRNANTPN